MKTVTNAGTFFLKKYQTHTLRSAKAESAPSLCPHTRAHASLRWHSLTALMDLYASTQRRSGAETKSAVIMTACFSPAQGWRSAPDTVVSFTSYWICVGQPKKYSILPFWFFQTNQSESQGNASDKGGVGLHPDSLFLDILVATAPIIHPSPRCPSSLASCFFFFFLFRLFVLHLTSINQRHH